MAKIKKCTSSYSLLDSIFLVGLQLIPLPSIPRGSLGALHYVLELRTFAGVDPNLKGLKKIETAPI